MPLMNAEYEPAYVLLLVFGRVALLSLPLA